MKKIHYFSPLYLIFIVWWKWQGPRKKMQGVPSNKRIVFRSRCCDLWNRRGRRAAINTQPSRAAGEIRSLARSRNRTRSGERAGRGGPGRGTGRRGGPRNVIGIACAGRRGSGHGTGRGAETGGGTENGSGSESGSGSGELHGTGRGPGSGSGFIRIPIPVPIFSPTSGMKFGFGPRRRRERFGQARSN